MRNIHRRRVARVSELRIAWAGLLLVTGIAAVGAQASPAFDSMRRADDALARGQYFHAIESFQLALRENPNHLDAVVGLAESYYRLEEYDQAQRYVERALRLARAHPVVLNLAGRVSIGRGDLAGAEDAFRRVQEIEPNNVEASIGRAELALARGRSAEAVGALERALRLNPDQQKALLSLVLVYEHLDEHETARRYLDLARSLHRDRPEVHTLAAEYYLRSADLPQAARAARTARAIDPANRAALSILARVALGQGDFEEAVEHAEALIANDRGDVRAWYVRAVASHELGRRNDALTSIRTALRVAPDDEVVRLWAEWLAFHLELDHPVRVELARARASTAAGLERAFRYDRALKAYRRALQLAPFDSGIRLEYAELFRRIEHRASYLQELEILIENGHDDQRLERTLEVYRNRLGGSVSSRWGIDQFTLTRSKPSVAVYLDRTADDAYPRSSEAILAFLRRTVEGLDRIEIADAAVVESYAEAFGRARSHDVSFFVHARVAVAPRSVTVAGSIHVARTGTQVVELTTIRSGPNHAATAADAFAETLVRALPVGGEVVRRDGRRVVIDLGARDGVTTGSRYDIVPAEAVSLAPDELLYVYRPERVIGTLTITAADDLVSEGVFDVSGIVDMVRSGDMVIAIADPDAAEPAASPTTGTSDDLFPILYERVRRLR